MNSMQVYGVIMAGGGGTRFWPLSRQKTPKQLLNLSGKDVMVNETIDRLALSIPGKNQYIVTSAAQAPAMARATEGRVLPEHILCEPSARNTAACIGYAALEIIKKRGDGILCVTPSDAYVRDWPAFNAVLEQAVQAAETQDKPLASRPPSRPRATAISAMIRPRKPAPKPCRRSWKNPRWKPHSAIWPRAAMHGTAAFLCGAPARSCDFSSSFCRMCGPRLPK